MKAKRTKLAACFMCAVFALGAFAGCGKSDPSPEQPVVPKPEEPAKSPWTAEPVVKGTFYSDFGSNEVIGENWSVVNYGWGQNGVTRDNVGFTRSPGVVKKAGATGGIVVLNSYGDYYSAASKRGQGGCLISNRLFGPGKYEVRMKVVPRFGPCSTAWSYYTNSYAITTPDGQIYGHNTADNIVYHEIDMECPRIGQGFRGWGGVAYEEYYQNEEDLREDGQGKVVNKSTGVPVATESPYNDGQWHTFAFEWRTQGYDYDESKGENPGAVIWYMDGKEVGRTAKNTPYYPDQLWIGNWFPDNSTDWLGFADFDEAYMYLDWVRITEYTDEYRTTDKQGNGIRPELGGCIMFSTSPGGNTNWAGKLPINDYVSNGKFLHGEDGDAVGWELKDAARTDAGLVIEGGSAKQSVSAQYEGYTFYLEAEAAGVTAGKSGKMYVEYVKGEYPERSNDNRKMKETVIGRSDAVIFTSAQTLHTEFTVPEGANNLRIVFEADDGTVFTVKRVKMHLKSDLAFL